MAVATQDITIWDETHAGNTNPLDAASLPATRAIVLFGASDGSNLRAVKTDSSGNLNVASTSVIGINARDGSSNLVDSSAYLSSGNAVFSDFKALDICERQMPLVAMNLGTAVSPGVPNKEGTFFREAEITTTSTSTTTVISADSGGLQDDGFGNFTGSVYAPFILGFSVNRCTIGSSIGAIVRLRQVTQSTDIVIAKGTIASTAGTEQSFFEVNFYHAISPASDSFGIGFFSPSASDVPRYILDVTPSGVTSTVWQGRLIYELYFVGSTP